MRSLLVIGCAACACALRAGPAVRAPRTAATALDAPARAAPLSPALRTARAAVAGRSAAVQMQSSFFDGYVESDPATGEQKSLSLGEKETRYLECLDAFYNEGGKQLLNNDDFDQLKLDLDFEGARVTTFSADEVKFVLANKRFSMGKAVLSDAEYDALRARLKAAGSPVVLHDVPSCSVDGTCKNELRLDKGKTRLLYLPGYVAGVIGVCELSFWTLGLDPILSIVLGAVPSYFFGKWFTENIFAQDPLATQSSCPNCNYLINVYFGDIFGVLTASANEGGKFAKPGNEVAFKCPNCKEDLIAQRANMIVSTVKPKAELRPDPRAA